MGLELDNQGTLYPTTASAPAASPVVPRATIEVSQPPAYSQEAQPPAYYEEPKIEKKVEELRYPHPNLHRFLLVLSAGLSIASVIPASRLYASLALRSVAFISSSAICADSWEKEDVSHRIMNVERIAIVALGIIGVAAAKPALYVASLAAEVGLQFFEVASALYDRDTARILTHLGILVIDSLMLAAVVTGSWQVMVTAAAVNAAAMLAFSVKAIVNNDELSVIDMLCHVAIAGASIASSIETAKIIGRKLVSADFEIKNENKDVEYVYNDKTKELICTIQPGETAKFSTNRYDVITQVRGENGFPEARRWADAYHHHYQTIVHQQPMNPKLYAAQPIGGTIVVDRNQD